MRNSVKIFLSFLLIYEPLAYWISNDSYVCENIFSSYFCRLDYRYIVLMATPIIFMAIYLLWEKQLKSIFKKKPKTKKTKKYKQRFIGPFEAIGRYIAKIFTINQTATRSEYFCAIIPVNLIFFVIQLLLIKITVITCENAYDTTCGFIHITNSLLVLFSPLMIYTLNARRWNDIGWNGKLMAIIPIILWYLSIFFTYVWMIPLLIFCLFQFIAFCFPSKFNNNRYRNKTQDLEENRMPRTVKIYTDNDDN